MDGDQIIVDETILSELHRIAASSIVGVRELRELCVPFVPLSEPSDMYKFMTGGGNCHVIQKCESFVGWVAYQSDGEVCRVQSICVAKELQCQGIGSELLSELKEQLPGQLCVVRWEPWRDLGDFFSINGFSNPELRGRVCYQSREHTVVSWEDLAEE